MRRQARKVFDPAAFARLVADVTKAHAVEPAHGPETMRAALAHVAGGDIAVRAGFELEPVRVAEDLEGTETRDNAPLLFTVSTESVDRYDSTIRVDGWRLENYRSNPVVLWSHDMWAPPIGRSRVFIEDGKLRSRAVFTPAEVNPLGAMVRRMYLEGFLHATSVSWDPLVWQFNEERGSWAIDYLEQDLLEWSAVSVPGNPEALYEARTAGIDLDPLAAWAEQHLDALVDRELGPLERKRVARLESIRRVAGREARLFVFSPAVTPANVRQVDEATPPHPMVDLVDIAERFERAVARLEGKDIRDAADRETTGRPGDEGAPAPAEAASDEGSGPAPAPPSTRVGAEDLAAAIRNGAREGARDGFGGIARRQTGRLD